MIHKCRVRILEYDHAIYWLVDCMSCRADFMANEWNEAIHQALYHYEKKTLRFDSQWSGYGRLR